MEKPRVHMPSTRGFMSTPPNWIKKMSSSFLLRVLSASLCAANKSGSIIRDVLKSGQLGIVQKGINDPQTEADRRAQRCIFATLKQRFPQLAIIGEEDVAIEDNDYTLVGQEEEIEEVLKETCPLEYQNVTEKDVIVWVDPVDGTKEFTEGFPEHVTVLIGISLKGVAVGGVIHQPFFGPNGRSIWGMLGIGMKGAVAVPVGDIKEKLKDGPRIVVTRSHMTQLVQDTVDSLKPSENLRVGGCGNKILMVIEGNADIYIFPSKGTKKWDSCAGEAIIHAIGGRLTDVLGQPIVYDGKPNNIMNFRGLLVSMRSHDDLVARIPQHVQEFFLTQ